MLNAAPVSIIIADDDTDDCRLLKRAFSEAGVSNPLAFYRDGESLMEALQSSRPGLILLDLNMPRRNGKEALKAIRADRRHKKTPVVVLSTSKAHNDVIESYELGANSFISKPMSYKDVVEMVKLLKKYWLERVELPSAF
jgi:DNA-binding response OmpR family regulator